VLIHLRHFDVEIRGIRVRGLGAAAPWARPLFFGQMLNFSDRSQLPKMKKIVFIKREMEFISSSEMKCPKSWIFTNNYWWGESGKAVLQRLA